MGSDDLITAHVLQTFQDDTLYKLTYLLTHDIRLIIVTLVSNKYVGLLCYYFIYLLILKNPSLTLAYRVIYGQEVIRN